MKSWSSNWATTITTSLCVCVWGGGGGGGGGDGYEALRFRPPFFKELEKI